ncbi:AraC family transcriptional regulator [Paenibacillus sp. HB172176]|uniref:AraC family transcriptional regulator n=1 Tax=Paenibacillus sp. HB172176 TaxID=2493690 RepID=UPI001438B534|nr:AraC family transcriptional regulator [Paenibacillus sp. HB172176]
MTFPKTYDSAFFPILSSSLPLVVSKNTVSRHFHLHRHDCIEFSLVLEGSGTEWVNGVPHPLKPGTVTFILPYQFHEIYNQGAQPLQLFNCMFGIELLGAPGQHALKPEEWLPGFSESPHCQLTMPTQHEQLFRLMNELLEEFQGDAALRAPLLKAKLSEILIRLRRFRSIPAQTSTGMDARPAYESPLISQILLYLTIHYGEELSLEAVAARFHISKVHLCNELKKSTSKTFKELVNEVRLRQACSLLVSTKLKVTDIGHEAGFQSAATFFRIFKQNKGMSPEEYRNL